MLLSNSLLKLVVKINISELEKRQEKRDTFSNEYEFSNGYFILLVLNKHQPQRGRYTEYTEWFCLSVSKVFIHYSWFI